MSDIATLLAAVKQKAVKGGLPTRRKDSALYGLLAGMLFICEKVDRERLHDELIAAITVHVDVKGEGNSGKGRRYVNDKGDTFVLVCRHVLGNIDTRDAVYRYARNLREASQRQISPHELGGWLRKNGGLAALTVVKPRGRLTKVLRLDRQIGYDDNEEFTVTLKSLGGGVFQVIKTCCDVIDRRVTV